MDIRAKGQRRMNAENMHQRLAEIICELSLRTGHFVLASGKTSSYYLDCRKTTLHPEGSYLVGELMNAALGERGWDVAAVGGLTLGADPVATAVALTSHLRGRPVSAFIVRKEKKEHGTGQRIEGAPPAGSRVVLVEDVVTTGGSTLVAARAVREAGLEVAGALAVVDREEGGREALIETGIELVSLFTASELLSLGG